MSIPRFLGIGNSLLPFSDTSDGPELPKLSFGFSQNKVKWPIGNFGSEHARDLILVPNPMFLGMGNHLGTEGQEHCDTFQG